MDENEITTFVRNVFVIVGQYLGNDQEIPVTRLGDRFLNVIHTARRHTVLDRIFPTETDFYYAANSTWQSEGIDTAIADLHVSKIFYYNGLPYTSGRLNVGKPAREVILEDIHELLLGDSIATNNTKEKLKDFMFRKIAEAYLTN